MSPNDAIMQIFLDRCLFYFDFDLLDGIVEKDVVDRNGNNYTKTLGLISPCKFDDLMKNSYDKNYFELWHVVDAQIDRMSQENLIQAYQEGKRLVETTLYSAGRDVYNRISFYLIPDEDKDSVHAFVCSVDTTKEEKSREVIIGNLCDEKSDIDEIIASAEMGIWHITLFEGEEPKMTVTPKMCELLGISSEDKTEEEMYEAWYRRVKKSSMPSVVASFREMTEKGFSENTYIWNHPTKGDTFVRCGGNAQKVEGKGYVLRGYHSDITETVTAETKQKELLSDALEEVKKQKKLLQEALDNYKEADYDRRRDFLTGLRNRQDMFEFLQDVLSRKRENINAMFMMDIDNFKLLNDHYGHSYGDECLKRIGDALNQYAEQNDIYFYRYGGEEILGIGFDADKDAAVIAKELVQLVYDLQIKRDDVPTGTVTISLGYTTNNHRYEKMIDKADTAMYQAKGHGKNQAVCFEEI